MYMWKPCFTTPRILLVLGHDILYVACAEFKNANNRWEWFMVLTAKEKRARTSAANRAAKKRKQEEEAAATAGEPAAKHQAVAGPSGQPAVAAVQPADQGAPDGSTPAAAGQALLMAPPGPATAAGPVGTAAVAGGAAAAPKGKSRRKLDDEDVTGMGDKGELDVLGDLMKEGADLAGDQELETEAGAVQVRYSTEGEVWTSSRHHRHQLWLLL